MTEAPSDRRRTSCVLARRFADLQAEVAAIPCDLPGVQVTLDRRIRERP